MCNVDADARYTFREIMSKFISNVPTKAGILPKLSASQPKNRPPTKAPAKNIACAVGA